MRGRNTLLLTFQGEIFKKSYPLESRHIIDVLANNVCYYSKIYGFFKKIIVSEDLLPIFLLTTLHKIFELILAGHRLYNMEIEVSLFLHNISSYYVKCNIDNKALFTSL